MRPSLEFVLGLLDRNFPAFASAEDLSGPHGAALRLWQRLGLLSREPERNPVPSCPHCREGEPYPIADRFVCSVCTSRVDPRHLQLWRFNMEAFLSWLARKFTLQGGLRQVDDQLWQLGSLKHGGLQYECFFGRGGTPPERSRQRMLAYKNALLLRGPPSAERVDGFDGPCVSLVETLRQERRSLKVADLARLLQPGGTVRFAEATGAVWARDAWLGEVPVGSKEYFLLACLSRRLDAFVPYGDIKDFVLRQSKSTDATEEATFCQRLKSRIKKRVPVIDTLIVTTNKGDGYRLRGYVES